MIKTIYDIEGYAKELERLELGLKIAVAGSSSYKVYVVDSSNRKLTKGFRFSNIDKGIAKVVSNEADFGSRKLIAIARAFNELVATNYIYKLAHETNSELVKLKEKEYVY
ncbi:hypothetical protein [Salinicola sp. MIT1003]|uniref:hypothetical protein n=1 Tax=Salinicola sp. MIT1003 TaxID=1882734 RepID=UPI0008DC7310|nr:hypothetical protein [Salinicola sp. MIT1003]OHZ02993.1 hypothetical protein BC443_14990 [Salinicola sp. MIT1003]